MDDRCARPINSEPVLSCQHQISTFLDVVFGYCEGLIPVRAYVDKGQQLDRAPQTCWMEADTAAAGRIADFATSAAADGMGVFVVPGTVATVGQAKATDVRQIQTVLVDLDDGDIAAKRDHLACHLGAPTLEVASGGLTHEGQAKLHLYWRLSEPAASDDLDLVCGLRGQIAGKVGGDRSFRSAHQPIRVAGTIYCKGGDRRRVEILQHRHQNEWHLADLAELVAAMPTLSDGADVACKPSDKPALGAVLTNHVHERGADGWTRFEGASAAIGHFVRMEHDGRMEPDEAWAAICQYNAAMLRPSWPLDRLRHERDRLWARHV